ncbi:MAG: ATP synthase F1 subunit delta [Flavobacteriaceae bacterium]
MNESRAAVRYAKAALEISIESKATTAVEKDMRGILETLEESKELRDVLDNPIITGEQKKSILLKVFAKSEEITKNLLTLLVDNKRISVLDEVASKYIYLHDLMKGEKVAEITTAIPLPSELFKEILKKVENLTGSKVALENKIDESIIGGFVLRVGDMQFNASIANQLNSLKRDFKNS